MRSYLSLIPISAKVRRRQNRMTILCIVCAVFLVTAIFSVTDMMIRTESSFMLSKHGNWHIKLENVSRGITEEISGRPDVTAIGASSVFNFDGELPYRINEKRAALYGTEETYMNEISDGITEGFFRRVIRKCCSALMQQLLLECRSETVSLCILLQEMRILLYLALARMIRDIMKIRLI